MENKYTPGDVVNIFTTGTANGLSVVMEVTEDYIELCRLLQDGKLNTDEKGGLLVYRADNTFFNFLFKTNLKYKLNKIMKINDNLECVNIEPFKNNTIAPELTLNGDYKALDIFMCKCGEQHINVGLKLEINYVECYKCRETLPDTNHWCHSSRFIVKQ